MNTVLLATRKGLIVFERSAAGWRHAAIYFAGDALSNLLVDSRDGSWYAALRLGHFGVKLRRSTDRGASWTELSAPAFPLKPESGPLADDATPWTLDMIWTLAAGGANEPGVLWAGCLPAGLFRSNDGGTSWRLIESLWQDPRRLQWGGGGYDHAGIHSVLVDPRDARKLMLAVSSGGIWATEDAGATWELRGRGLRADFMPPELAEDPNSQDPHSISRCAAEPDVLWCQHHCGIYRSTDDGRTWTEHRAQPSSFGFVVVADPKDPQRAWFVPAQKDQFRIPVDGRVVVTRTDDGGRSFTAFGAGLPSEHAYHLVYRHGMALAPNGRQLAIGSTTGGAWISEDAGEHWAELSRDLPPIFAVHFAD